jgi:hypothetical protein
MGRSERKNLNTGFKRDAASDGGYVFPLLPVGV